MTRIVIVVALLMSLVPGTASAVGGVVEYEYDYDYSPGTPPEVYVFVMAGVLGCRLIVDNDPVGVETEGCPV